MALAVAVLAMATLGAGARWFIAQPWLRVEHVTFEGLRHESEVHVLDASGLKEHPSMFSVSSRVLESHLRGFAWISRVTLEKHWPNSVVVIVHESTPVAVAYGAHHVLQFVDARGRDLGPAPSGANLPTIVDSAQRPGAWLLSTSGQGAAFVASRLPRAFAWQVSQILISHSGSISLKMTTPVTFVLGQPTNLEKKFVAVASVIAHTTLGPGDVVDVTVPDELAVTGPPPQ